MWKTGLPRGPQPCEPFRRRQPALKAGKCGRPYLYANQHHFEENSAHLEFSPLGLRDCRSKSRFGQILPCSQESHWLGPGCLIPPENSPIIYCRIYNEMCPSKGFSGPSWRRRVGFPLIYCEVVYPMSAM